MTTPTHPDIPSQKIACSVCLVEIPLNLVDIPEGADYVGHYCGIECYEEFSSQQQAETSAQPGKDQK
jgi:hypothetical protein